MYRYSMSMIELRVIAIMLILVSRMKQSLCYIIPTTLGCFPLP